MRHHLWVRLLSAAFGATAAAALYPLYLPGISSTSLCQGVGAGCPCEPAPDPFVHVAGPLRIAFGPGFEAYPYVRDSLAPAQDYWNALLQSYGRGLTTVESTADSDIQINLAVLPDGMFALAGTFSDGSGSLAVNINQMDHTDPALWRHVLGHELGHHLGFVGTCADPTRSIMAEAIFAAGPFAPLSLTEADRCGLQRMFSPQDHPFFSWCYGGGCTPGYRRDCSLGGDREQDECGCCWNFTPILIDVGGRGISMGNPYRGPLFDIAGLGRWTMLSWPVGSDDAWLALDVNRNGAIDSGAELFGNTTAIRPGEFAQHGYDALASLDDNRDRRLDAHDAVFGRLVLWRDRNQDGRSTTDELQAVSRSGVVAISLEYRTMSRIDEWGNRFEYAAPVYFSTAPYMRWSVDVFPVRVTTTIKQ